MPGPPESEIWRRLLAVALAIVDSLDAAGYGRLAFRLGGGTILAMRFGHRISNDIDLFIDDAQALGFLTPRLNETSASLAGEYQEAANSLKLVRPEGDIDFILAGPVTRQATQDSLDLDGRIIALESTVEILAKELLYRAASFKPRDVFDLAVVLRRQPGDARAAIAATRSAHPLLKRRLAHLRGLDATALAADIEATPEGRPYLDGMVDHVETAIERFT